MKTPRWIDRKSVRKRYNTSDSSITRWVKARVFPAPARIGVNTDRWDENILDEYDAVNKKGYEPITRYLDQNLTLFSFLNSLIYELLRFFFYLYVKSHPLFDA